MPTEYDIAAAFEAIENELISSMMRNMKHHRAEETDEGYNWSAWQAEQLKALDTYKKNCRKIYPKQFRDINRQLEVVIRQAHEQGGMEQEETILRAIQQGAALHHKDSSPLVGSFFRVNERKLNALIDATVNDMQKAETAILRRANDQYRKIIFNAQVYANTGAGTYEKAVDMATKDFLSSGIRCVVYANGARHTLADYAEMALRTASKRAYLQGEGQKRQEWGIPTVILNKRGNACPLCAPFCGKVFIDDVWSGGKASDGKYPLLSSAIAAGLYHPRCKDSHTTFFPGINEESKPWTKEERQKLAQNYNREQKQQHAQRQAKRQDNLAKHSLDPENRQIARHRANQWKEQAAPFQPAKTVEKAQEYAQKFCKKSFMDRTFKGEATFKGISVEHANAINRALTDVYDQFPELDKLSGIKVVSPKTAQGKKAFPGGEDALFSYSPVEHGIYVNRDILKDSQALDAYMQRSKEAWDLVMNNIGKLSGAQREMALRYQEAGRDLVSGATVEGLFTHELGHHVQWTMLAPKATNSITSRMWEYAPHLSGYATASKSEYLAESFAAYMKGERGLLDPEYVELLDKRLKGATDTISAGALNGASEFIRGFHEVHGSNVVEKMRREYTSWRETLSDAEEHAIRKYTKNGENEKRPKFYERLNAMLRGEAPENERLRRYADTISEALRRKPLEQDIICFRNVTVNPFGGAVAGDVVSPRQFFSTSVVPGGTIGKNECKLIIFARKGTQGAYIEELSAYPKQREFLIDKDCKYRVLSIHGNEISLEVVV